MILITGATGNLGTAVVQQLLTIKKNDAFVVTSSNQKGVDELKEKGLQVRLANFNDPSSLVNTFEGIEKLLLISTMNQNRFEEHKNVIDAAKAQGVKHIVYTGLAINDIQTSAVKDLMQSHFETEAYIQKSGLTFTFVRNTMYADALLQILGPNALTQPIFLPGGNGRVPYALRREMGEGIANLLVQDGHEDKVYNITGNTSYSYTDVAEYLTKLTGNSISYSDIESDAFVAQLKEMNFPDFLIYLHAGTIQDIKDHQYELESRDLERLLGRPTADLNAMLKELFTL